MVGHGARIIHLFASDDQGRTWKWLAPKGLEASIGRGKLKCNGKLLVMTDPMAANTWMSADAGETWEGPYATGAQRAALSVVNGEFWLCGKRSRASSDGKTWRDLPAAIPEGQVIAGDKGTIISIHPQRFNIQRSTDGGTTWHDLPPGPYRARAELSLAMDELLFEERKRCRAPRGGSQLDDRCHARSHSDLASVRKSNHSP